MYGSYDLFLSQLLSNGSIDALFARPAPPPLGALIMWKARATEN